MQRFKDFLAEGYKIVFSNQMRDKYIHPTTTQHLTTQEWFKFKRAPVMLVFDSGSTAHLGAPIKWTAPNGVIVVYMRGQRRNGNAEKTGAPSAAVYHDFWVTDEFVVALTRHIGPARRALRAWADAHMGSTVTARFQARQMVRPGD